MLFRSPNNVRSKAREGVLVQCPHFTTERLSGPRQIPALDRNQSLIVIQGSGSIAGEPARAGEVFLLPAGETADIAGDITILRTHP